MVKKAIFYNQTNKVNLFSALNVFFMTQHLLMTHIPPSD